MARPWLEHSFPSCHCAVDIPLDTTAPIALKVQTVRNLTKVDRVPIITNDHIDLAISVVETQSQSQMCGTIGLGGWQEVKMKAFFQATYRPLWSFPRASGERAAARAARTGSAASSTSRSRRRIDRKLSTDLATTFKGIYTHPTATSTTSTDTTTATRA